MVVFSLLDAFKDSQAATRGVSGSRVTPRVVVFAKLASGTTELAVLAAATRDSWLK